MESPRYDTAWKSQDAPPSMYAVCQSHPPKLIRERATRKDTQPCPNRQGCVSRARQICSSWQRLFLALYWHLEHESHVYWHGCASARVTGTREITGEISSRDFPDYFLQFGIVETALKPLPLQECRRITSSHQVTLPSASIRFSFHSCFR